MRVPCATCPPAQTSSPQTSSSHPEYVLAPDLEAPGDYFIKAGRNAQVLVKNMDLVTSTMNTEECLQHKKRTVRSQRQKMIERRQKGRFNVNPSIFNDLNHMPSGERDEYLIATKIYFDMLIQRGMMGVVSKVSCVSNGAKQKAKIHKQF